MDLQHLRASDGTGEAVLANVDATRTIGSTVLSLDNVDNWNTKCVVVTGTPAANGFIATAGMTIMYGHITAGDFIIDGYAPGYTDNGNTTDEVAIIKMTTNWADALVDILETVINDNGTLKGTAVNGPQGFLMNGQIVRSVATNDLTVAIKTLAGTDPSATDPVYVRIGTTVRTITAALSITLNDGTNWFGAGASYFGAAEGDFFAYLIWNTNTSAVTIGIAKEPDMRVFSDRNATATTYGHLAITGTAPAATDEVEVVGRFNAILGVTATFNWSLPATAVIINRPIFESRIFSFTNSATQAGTFYYQQRFTRKEVWGETANRVTASGAAPQLSASATLTLPVGFFSAIQYTNAQASDSYSASNIFAGSVQSHTTTTITGAGVMSIGSNGQCQLQFHVVGS